MARALKGVGRVECSGGLCGAMLRAAQSGEVVEESDDREHGPERVGIARPRTWECSARAEHAVVGSAQAV